MRPDAFTSTERGRVRRTPEGLWAFFPADVPRRLHIVEASAARGLDTSVPDVPRSLAVRAIDAGHGRDGFSRIIDVLRRPGAPSLG